jgi:hypothetical protein
MKEVDLSQFGPCCQSGRSLLPALPHLNATGVSPVPESKPVTHSTAIALAQAVWHCPNRCGSFEQRGNASQGFAEAQSTNSHPRVIDKAAQQHGPSPSSPVTAFAQAMISIHLQSPLKGRGSRSFWTNQLKVAPLLNRVEKATPCETHVVRV